MKQIINTVIIEKIVYGGQGLATLDNGKKVLVWGGLPGEKVKIQTIKNKKNWAEGIVEEVITKSIERVSPYDSKSYLSTSPWQILKYDYENELKQNLIIDQFNQHGIKVELNTYSAPKNPYHYRNKVEFSFWWNNETNQLDLAFFKRGTHYKQPVDGTSLAHSSINEAATKIRDHLRKHNVEARDLKTLLIRSNQQGEVVAELYVKIESFEIPISIKQLDIKGFSIHYSNPKSPASIKTKTLSSSSATQLKDIILGKEYTYATDGFFQVSIPMYEAALKSMQKFIDPKKPLLDMYSGVGSIGLSIAKSNQHLQLVEIDERCVIEARNNVKYIKPDTEVLLSSTKTALEYITQNKTIILDPPRAGLHQKVIDRLLKVCPDTIIYLSCNPATQARDIALLHNAYQVRYVHGFNFFPRTPHIENLIILQYRHT